MKFLRSCLLVLLVLSMCAGVLASCKKDETPSGDEDPCADGHTPGVWTTVTEPTATTDGLREQVCAVCGEVIDSEVVAALGFDLGVTFSETTSTLDLSDYTVVYPDNYNGGLSLSSTFTGAVEKLAKRISDATGATVPAYTMRNTPTSEDDPEILVGVLSEEHSEALAESFKGHGYAIRVVDNKILIQGTTNLLTMQAMELFIDQYLLVDSPKQSFEIHDAVDSDPVEMMVLASVSGAPYAIVRSHFADDDPEVEYGATYGNSYVDYEVTAATTLKNTIASITGINADNIRQTTDITKKNAKELLVGHTTRDESDACRNLLQGHEYGIFISGHNSVVLTAWSDANLQYCVKRFIDYIWDNRYDENGESSIILPATYMEKNVAKEGWKTDFPRPELPLVGALDCENDTYQYTYMGDGVDADAYTDYCNALKQNGYTVLMQSGNVEDSYFTTFVNHAKKTSLYVAYNAYKHAAELPSTEKYDGAKPTIRVISSNTETTALPTSAMTSFTPFEQSRTPGSSLTAVSMDSAGTGYVMQLEDGSFIVMDGGTNSVGTEAANLYNIMVAQHTKAWGNAPSASRPIHIRAWIISHSHGDHYNTFGKFATNYGKSGHVKMDYLLGNFPEAASFDNVAESDKTMLNNMESYRNRFSEPFTFLKVHTGQKLWFANAQIEVMFTHEDRYPQPIMAFNDTSTVVRISVLNTDGTRVTTGSKATTFTATGDLYRYGGRWMCAMFGDYLKSDMVALAHHGGPGAEAFYYEKVAATALWVPNNTTGFNGWLNRSDWIGTANKRAATYSTVKYIICADYKSANSNSTADDAYKNPTMDIKASGVDYENAYSAGVSYTISYTGTNASTGRFNSTSAQVGRR